MIIRLRAVETADLDRFFTHQLDPMAQWLAAFIAKDPTDRVAFMNHWQKVLNDSRAQVQTILLDEQVVGNVLCHRWFGEPEVGYWLDRAVWGRGVATAALGLFLQQVSERPLFARVVDDNIGSRRVLEKCGFLQIGETTVFANGRDDEVRELLFKLS